MLIRFEKIIIFKPWITENGIFIPNLYVKLQITYISAKRIQFV